MAFVISEKAKAQFHARPSIFPLREPASRPDRGLATLTLRIVIVREEIDRLRQEGIARCGPLRPEDRVILRAALTRSGAITMMTKDDVVGALREMADLLEITDANSFEVMAYRNGAQALDDWSGDLNQTVENGRVTEIPSIGKGLSQVISDLIRAGASSELDRVRGLVPPELPALLRIRGLGPKRVRALWRELEIESLDDLRRATERDQLTTLRGFGPKMVERVKSGLDYLGAETPRATVPAGTVNPLPQSPAASGRIWAGTSGYSYPEWRGTFYPEDARPDDFLKLYAEQLQSVEVNNTFYRFPSPKVIQQWTNQTPEHFLFAIKAHRRITHQLRLGPSAAERIVEFVERCGQLGSRLGCVLFQLPPDFSRDDSRLDRLMRSLPSGPRYAIEFRHESWFDEDVFSKLRGANIACVCGDAEGQNARRCVTAEFVYARLRQGKEVATLDEWDAWFRQQQAEQRDVLAYVKHDENGDVPHAVMELWNSARPSAREILRDRLAKPAKKTSRRSRKSG